MSLEELRFLHLLWASSSLIHRDTVLRCRGPRLFCALPRPLPSNLADPTLTPTPGPLKLSSAN